MSLTLQEREGVFITVGAGAGGVDLTPLLVQLAAPVAIVFNVDWSIDYDDGMPANAGELAADVGVQTEVQKLVDGRELLVMASADLPAFFDGWRRFGPRNVDVLDWPAPPTATELGEAVAAVDPPESQQRRFLRRGHKRRLRSPVLSSLARPTFHYHGHDDYYFGLESRTDRLARLVLRRLIALEAGSAWKRQSVTVPDPGDDVVARLLDDSHKWTSNLSDSTPESVTIALTARGARGGRSSLKPSYVAIFHIPSQEWELLRVVT